MVALISIVLILAALLLIGVILIQPGKGDMISGMSGIGGQFNQMLGTSKASSFLSNFTWGTALVIVVLTLVVNIFFVGSDGGNVQKAPTEGRVIQNSPAPVQTTPTPPQQNNQQQNQ